MLRRRRTRARDNKSWSRVKGGVKWMSYRCHVSPLPRPSILEFRLADIYYRRVSVFVCRAGLYGHQIERDAELSGQEGVFIMDLSHHYLASHLI